ncbi:MAG TPA: TetR/AcrR family transcriptional regulator [Casimicrobiaceae bacterium]|nr:TetR/AcrR family transcriptional regulator [Casimicrobiaceae bacterium]
MSPAATVARAGAARRPVRDSERTKAAILDAATSEFARHGPGGARVDRIALRARTNKRMLYYYFGSKEGLFLAVLEATYARIRAAERGLSLLDVPPEEAIRRLVRFTWEYYLAHPEFLSLLNSENLHRGSHLRRSRNVRSMNSPVIETLGEVLARGAREGIFRTGVDALQLYISIAALSYFYLGNHHTLTAVFGRDLAAPRARRARLAHMIDLVLGYLRHPA